jgi:predicted nucleic acid-binding protein
MSFLIDTNVVSELSRPRPNRGVLAWADSTGTVAISVITVHEIVYGLAWKPHPPIKAWFDEYLATCEVLPITHEIAARSGELRGRLQARGIVRSQFDMLIAGTAQVHVLTLVTRNTRDFEECLIPLLNPFS